MTSSRRFITGFFVALASSLAALVCFNSWVDPYDLDPRSDPTGLDVAKPMVSVRQKISKPGAAERIRPTGAIFGTSRSHHALDPNHPAWRTAGITGLNLAQAGTSIYDVRRNFEHVLAVAPLRTAIVELDMHMFNVNRSSSADFDDEMLMRYPGDLRPLIRKLTMKLSWSMTVDSWETIRRSPSSDPDTDRYGRTNEQAFENRVVRYGGIRETFLVSEKSQYLLPYLNTAPNRRLALRRADGSSMFEELRMIANIARSSRVDVRFYIPPLHARQLELYRILGIWPLFEDWKREVVQVLKEEAAANAGASPFPLWDFSGYDSITTESLPEASDAKTRMQWYWESSHFRRATGDLVLNRILDPAGTNWPAPKDFGTQISSENLEEHLAAIRTSGIRYRETHRPDVEEIEHLYRTLQIGRRVSPP